MTGGDKAFWVKCSPCGHIWAAAYYPCEMAKFAKIMKKIVCPKCGETKKIFMAKQNAGVLNEA